MPNLITLVEGPGDSAAVPLLLRKLLHGRQVYDWQVPRPMEVGSIGRLRRDVTQLVTYAADKPACGGVLILLDMDDGCPVDEARALAASVRAVQAPVPVAIVFAHREYEAWFLASLATLAGTNELPAGLSYSGKTESLRDVKDWFTQQLPPGRIYKPATHQARYTDRLDPALAATNSRSFRRLERAVDQLLALAGTSGRGVVTP